MNTMKMMIYFFGLIVLGTVAFAAFGWLIQFREGRTVHAGVQTPQEARQNPVAMVAKGARTSAETAKKDLEEGKRSKAVHALDASMRAAEVGTHAAETEDKTHFEHAVKSIQDARRFLQNGRPDKAPESLAKAVDALSKITDQESDPKEKSNHYVWREYEGAQMINAQGIRIGELETILPSGNGTPLALLRLGGQDIFGFLDLGGKRLKISADKLVCGRRQSIGATLVALPTFETASESMVKSASLALQQME